MLAKIANVNVEVAYSRQIHKLDNSASIEVPEKNVEASINSRDGNSQCGPQVRRSRIDS